MRNETPHPAQQHLDGPSECVGSLDGAVRPQALGSAVPFQQDLGTTPTGSGLSSDDGAASVSTLRASIPSAEWIDTVTTYEASVRNLWRAIRGLNRCDQVRCSDLKGENCICYEEYAAQLAWAFDEHLRVEGVLPAQGTETGTDETACGLGPKGDGPVLAEHAPSDIEQNPPHNTSKQFRSVSGLEAHEHADSAWEGENNGA